MGPQPIPNVYIPVDSDIYQLAKLCCNLKDADLSSEQVFLGGPSPILSRAAREISSRGMKVVRFLEDSFVRKFLPPYRLTPAARDGLLHLGNNTACGGIEMLRAGREVAFLVALESYLLSSVREPFLVRCEGVGVDSDAEQLWIATKLRKLGDLSSLVCAWETDERGEPLSEHSKEQQAHDRQEVILQLARPVLAQI